MIPATRIDSIVHELGRCSVPFQLWGVWDLPGRLDETRLRRAIDCLLDRAPVLKCRLERGFWRDRFVPMEDLDREALLVVDECADAADKSRVTDRIVDTVLDIEKGPGVRLHYLHGDGSSRLILHLHHLFADGRGMVNLMTELARIYTRLEQEPDYRPEVPLETTRGLWQIVRRLTLKNWLLMGASAFVEQILKSLVTPGQLEPLAMDKNPAITGRLGRARHLCIVIDASAVDGIKRWCRALDAKVNDFLMTAVMVAIARWNREAGTPAAKYLPLVFAADMRRRWAPGAGPVANLSTAHRFWLKKDEISGFESTARIIKRRIDGMKSLGLGLDGIAAVLSLGWIPTGLARVLFKPVFSYMAKTMFHASGLTNIGPIPDEAGRFGKDVVAGRCSIIVPIFPAKNVLFSATTYRNNITLEMSYDGAGLSDEAARAFKELLLYTVREGIERGGQGVT